MTNSLVETLVGALVLAVAGLFLVFAYTRAEVGSASGYTVLARFDRVDGIAPGSDVRIAGIKVGSVSSLELDSQRYLAHVKLRIDEGVQLPDDSQIKIASNGLLGDAYLSIEAGGNDTYLADGDEIANTQGAIDLMGLISKAIFSLSSGPSESDGPKSAEGALPAVPSP